MSKGKDECYFVELVQVEDAEEVLSWPDEELMAAVARQVDRVDRLEEVAARMRIHWAEEILLEEMWAKLKRVTELRKWAKQILLQKFSKVLIEKKVNLKKRTKRRRKKMRLYVIRNKKNSQYLRSFQSRTECW